MSSLNQGYYISACSLINHNTIIKSNPMFLHTQAVLCVQVKLLKQTNPLWVSLLAAFPEGCFVESFVSLFI